nr:GDP-mannose 4,6-dehydratase [Ferrimicrobium acidiphilum]
MNNRRALITGITGQDGAYLAKLLLDEGYEVYGAYRRSSTGNLGRLQELGVADAIHLEPFELLEFSNILRSIERIHPDEIYNLAAQSFVGTSFELPIFTSDVNALGVARILEAIRVVAQGDIRFYQASTSEMFGKAAERPQRETTPFHPRSPYGVSKVYSYWLTVNYREAFGIHGSNGILFNHESPYRGLEFVTRKITYTLAEIRHGMKDLLELGNIDAKRDWGYAGDYVRGMWLMLQQDTPDDYILASGETHSVREFLELAAEAAEFHLSWEQTDGKWVGTDRRSGKTIVRTSANLMRPAEVDELLGDASKAATKLGWKPDVTLPQLVAMMVESDLRRVREEGR